MSTTTVEVESAWLDEIDERLLDLELRLRRIAQLLEDCQAGRMLERRGGSRG